MSEDVRRILTNPAILIAAIVTIAGYGVLTATVASQGSEITKLRTLPERISTLESEVKSAREDVKWLRTYFENRARGR